MERHNIPLAIIIAGLVIAGAIYFKGARAGPGDGATGPAAEQLAQIRDLGPEDHWRGPSEAEIVLVEYSDLECPFCKQFHQTVIQLMAQRPEVAWVYRHFPLDQIHPQARAEAEATECVAELGGNDKFWQYVDKIFEVTPSNNGLDLRLLPQLAEGLGIERAAFERCVESGQHAGRVQNDLDNAVSAGGQGTPFTVIISAKGDRIPLAGSLPLNTLDGIINQLLTS